MWSVRGNLGHPLGSLVPFGCHCFIFLAFQFLGEALTKPLIGPSQRRRLRAGLSPKFFASCEKASRPGIFRKVGDMTLEDWHRNIDLNLNGPFYCSREVLERFRKRGGGFIVDISSLAGRNAFSGGAGYGASKFGIKWVRSPDARPPPRKRAHQ